MSEQQAKTPTTIQAAKAADKSATKAVPPKPRASFAALSFGNLRAASGEGQGEALRLLLVDIIEDADQPRKVFDQAELESMAESIRSKGVLQPIVVRPAVDGRYMLAFGARRFRASKLADMKDIPAVVRARSDDDFAAQIIENQHRANLVNSELAASITQLSAEGNNNKQIAAICNLKDYQVAAFKQACNFPPELRERMDNADMRALYDLFRQWGKTPGAVIDALPDPDTFLTVTEARRIIGSITGKATGSIVLDRQAAPTPPPTVEPTSPIPAASSPEQNGPQEAVRPSLDFSLSKSPLTPAASSDPAPIEPHVSGQAAGLADVSVVHKGSEMAAGDAHAASSLAPTFIVQGKGTTQGVLVVDRRAERENWVLVQFAEGIEEVALDELRIVRIE